MNDIERKIHEYIWKPPLAIKEVLYQVKRQRTHKKMSPQRIKSTRSEEQSLIEDHQAEHTTPSNKSKGRGGGLNLNTQ